MMIFCGLRCCPFLRLPGGKARSPSLPARRLAYLPSLTPGSLGRLPAASERAAMHFGAAAAMSSSPVRPAAESVEHLGSSLSLLVCLSIHGCGWLDPENERNRLEPARYGRIEKRQRKRMCRLFFLFFALAFPWLFSTPLSFYVGKR